MIFDTHDRQILHILCYNRRINAYMALSFSQLSIKSKLNSTSKIKIKYLVDRSIERPTDYL